MKVELDLSNYTTKADLKNTTGVYTSDFANKIDLANLNSDVDKSGINWKIYQVIEPIWKLK